VWRDLPTEWVTNHSFRHARAFSAGPFKTLVATLRLQPEGQGTRGEYAVEVEPAGLLGHAALLAGFFRSAGQPFTRLANEAAAFASGQREEPFSLAIDLSQDARSRLQAIAGELERQGLRPDLVQRFVRFIAEGSEIDLARIRPLRLARQWGEPERDLI